MAKLKPCPFCGGKANVIYDDMGKWFYVACVNDECPIIAQGMWHTDMDKAIEEWNTRTPKERGVDKPKITCLNCRHLMFSDCYGECNKQLRIVNPSDTCEYAEPKERGGEK